MIGDMFKYRILLRGYHYYLESQVYNVVKKDGIYYGQVNGSKVYDVHVKLTPQGKVSYMDCNCPYAEDGKKCKHEAALLFEILGVDKMVESDAQLSLYDDNFYYDQYEFDEDDEFEEFNEFNEFEEFDIDYDDQEFNDDRYQFSESTIIEQLERMSKQEILEIVDRALKTQNVEVIFQDLVDEKLRVKKIDHLILEQITRNRLMNKEDLYELFESLKELEKYNQIQDQIILAQKAMENMFNIFPSMTNEQREVAYDLFILIEKHFDNKEYKQYVKAFETFICTYTIHPFTHLIMDYIYKRDHSLISLLENIEKEYKYEYSQKEMLAEKYFYIVTHYEKGCFDRCVHNYYHLPSFQMLLIDYYIENKEYQKAIQICKEAIGKKDKLIYHEKLIQIYKLTNQKQLLKEECKQILFYIKPGDLKYYDELKRCYHKSEWEKEKVILLKQMSEQHIDVLQIYLNEKMYDELFNYLMNEDDILRIKKYENIFRKRTPQKLIKYYHTYIMKSLKETGTREFYQELMGYLRVIREIDEDKAYFIYNQLMQLYPKRRALIEELGKVMRVNKNNLLS